MSTPDGPTTNKAPKRARVSDIDFVQACLAFKTYEEVAAIIGLTAESVQARARRLRKAGVRLPAFSRKRQVTNVTRLNDLIDGWGPEGKPPYRGKA